MSQSPAVAKRRNKQSHDLTGQKKSYKFPLRDSPNGLCCCARREMDSETPVKIESLCDHDYHLIASSLAISIIRDMSLLDEDWFNSEFMGDLQIERLHLLMKIERIANRGAQGLQIYLRNPIEQYDKLCAKRNAAYLAANNQTKGKKK